MSGTAQEWDSPSTGPPGWRGSPGSEAVSEHRLSSRELTRVCWPCLQCPPSDTSGSLLAERWAPARPKGCAKAHPPFSQLYLLLSLPVQAQQKEVKVCSFFSSFGNISMYLCVHTYFCQAAIHPAGSLQEKMNVWWLGGWGLLALKWLADPLDKSFMLSMVWFLHL